MVFQKRVFRTKLQIYFFIVYNVALGYSLGYFNYLLIFAKLIRIHGTNTDVLNKKSDIYSPTPYVSSAYRFIGPGVWWFGTVS
jgi:hypothetical protein